MVRRFLRAAPRARFTATVLAGALGGLAACQASAASTPSSEAPRVAELSAAALVDSAVLRRVVAIDSVLLAAEERGDTAAMRRQYAPDYYAVAPDGEMLSVRARLFRVARGVRAIDSSQTLTTPWARQAGPGAVIVTRSTRLWGRAHGEAVAGLTLRVTRLYVERNGDWRLLFQQGTPLADEHVAGTGPGAPPH